MITRITKVIHCTCEWVVNPDHEYVLARCDPDCECEGHRIMAGDHRDDEPRGGR